MLLTKRYNNNDGPNIKGLLMGFNVNFTQKPMIQSAQHSQDGGAGNLGYFEQGEKEKNDHKRDKSIFNDDVDTFKKVSDEDVENQEFSISNIIARLIIAIKDFFKKMLRISPE